MPLELEVLAGTSDFKELLQQEAFLIDKSMLLQTSLSFHEIGYEAALHIITVGVLRTVFADANIPLCN